MKRLVEVFLILALVCLPSMAFADTYNFTGAFNQGDYLDPAYSGSVTYDPVTGVGTMTVSSSSWNFSGAIVATPYDSADPGNYAGHFDSVYIHTADWSVYLGLAL